MVERLGCIVIRTTNIADRHARLNKLFAERIRHTHAVILDGEKLLDGLRRPWPLDYVKIYGEPFILRALQAAGVTKEEIG